MTIRTLPRDPPEEGGHSQDKGIPKCFFAKWFFGGLGYWYQGPKNTFFQKTYGLFGLGTPGLQTKTFGQKTTSGSV